MPTPASPNSISLSQVNDELGIVPNTTTISMDNAAVRTLAGVGGTGTIISMSDLRGKSAITPGVLNPITGLQSTQYIADSLGGTATIQLIMYSNGTWDVTGSSTGGGGGVDTASGNWYQPTTTNIGASYWVKFTRISGGGTATTAWLQLSSARTVTSSVSNNGINNTQYTVQISTNSAGTAIVSTTTNISLYASVEAV